MGLDSVALAVSLGVNVATLAFFALQTRYLSKQTQSLARNLEYASYQKMVDYLNEVNVMVIGNPEVSGIFQEMDFIKDRLNHSENLSVQKIGLAWLILNRYEAALVGHELGVIPDREWEMWQRRLAMDLEIPFIHDVWLHDVSNFEYTKAFKDLVAGLIEERESGRPDAAK